MLNRASSACSRTGSRRRSRSGTSFAERDPRLRVLPVRHLGDPARDGRRATSAGRAALLVLLRRRLGRIDGGAIAHDGRTRRRCVGRGRRRRWVVWEPLDSAARAFVRRQVVSLGLALDRFGFAYLVRVPHAPRARARHAHVRVGAINPAGASSRVWAHFVLDARDRVLQRSSSGQPALDAGCGAGLLVPWLRAGIDVDGCDVSADMIERCRERARCNALGAPSTSSTRRAARRSRLRRLRHRHDSRAGSGAAPVTRRT